MYKTHIDIFVLLSGGMDGVFPGAELYLSALYPHKIWFEFIFQIYKKNNYFFQPILSLSI